MAKKKKTGLGRGLDSLIPVFPEEDESDENSSLTLEDMLKDKDEEKEDKDSEKSNENMNNKKSRSSKKSKREATKSSKTTKEDEKTEIKESKTTSKEIATEKPSTHESIEDKIETKSQVEPSQIADEVDQPISETPKLPDTEDVKTPIETVQEIAIEDKAVELAKATETELATSKEPEKSVKDIRDSLTEREKQSIDEVIKIIDKNPRITLWSAKSAAVFRYLRKTEPEFSISKEASKLIDEAVQAKYPEIWVLFKDIEK